MHDTCSKYASPAGKAYYGFALLYYEHAAVVLLVGRSGDRHTYDPPHVHPPPLSRCQLCARSLQGTGRSSALYILDGTKLDGAKRVEQSQAKRSQAKRSQAKRSLRRSEHGQSERGQSESVG